MFRGGERDEVTGVTTAVRWLGAPTTVLALVVLVLNDQVWKYQWPGGVTGKISDIAGLVVAPPLLALGLAVIPRIRRADRWSMAAVTVGFIVVKMTSTGAEVASAVLSVVTPSLVRADPTDLFALPALLLAARTAAWARSTRLTRRHRSALTAGALVLPMAVIGTAATGACQKHFEASSVTAVTGRLASTPPGYPQDVVLRVDPIGLATLHDGRLVALTAADEERVRDVEDVYQYPFSESRRLSCSVADPRRCWRLPTKGLPRVELSTDGGLSWGADYAPSTDYRQDVIDDLGERCDESAVFDTVDLSVVDTNSGPIVVVALRAAGVAVRATNGSWTRIPLQASYNPPPPTAAPVGAEPTGRLQPVDIVPTWSVPRTHRPRPTATPTTFEPTNAQTP